jgi:hypothetical protein
MATYSFMVKSLDLLAEDEILEQSRTTLACLETVLVFNGTTDVRGQVCILVIQIELGEEFFSGGSIPIIATFDAVRTAGDVACHIRTSGIGNTNQAREKGERMHRDRKVERLLSGIQLGNSAFNDLPKN